MLILVDNDRGVSAHISRCYSRVERLLTYLRSLLEAQEQAIGARDVDALMAGAAKIEITIGRVREYRRVIDAWERTRHAGARMDDAGAGDARSANAIEWEEMRARCDARSANAIEWKELRARCDAHIAAASRHQHNNAAHLRQAIDMVHGKLARRVPLPSPSGVRHPRFIDITA